ncbi:uncharacterized protein BO97DRAFT_43387 [Aspergillus homomorphus CBS 101889]|uniref:F-box domain-containing protein n=1 Tax=Aspergillus homomorphus (strain CBS 101889) TaxID=1450537 RepID=A0A395HYP4_ASPHC|nr:hypothetical protein BO97DRAFT_43387 [Aspergillus homomorphus CBS 101889]RAL13062.1 hypothetical protein BO97DRAFT_43387 [Aspergillus homomorphus CBS 101889]
MCLLDSLPAELIRLFLDQLEYASDVNALGQTCCRLSQIVDSPYLYPRFAQLCSSEGLMIIGRTRSHGTVRKMRLCDVDMDQFYRAKVPGTEFTSLILELFEPS